MARQCHRQEEKQRLRQRGRKGRPPCRTDSHGLELLEETEKAAGEATDGNGRKNGTRCDGKCSALQWATQRAEMTDAACCIFLSTFPGNPEQSALISPPAHSSTQINQPSHHHRLSSAHLPTHVSSLTSTSYVLLKPRLLPQQARSSSTASALVFHSKRACPHTARALAPTLPERLPSPANTIVFHNQNVRIPLPARSFSSACTFGFLCLHACLPLPARSASPVRTLVIRSQPNHTPNRPALLHPLMQQGQHADVAQHAALAVMVSARQASMRCGGEP